MARLPCPFPAVEEALEPYIHTRQDALRIRQQLAVFLSSQLTTTGSHGTLDAGALSEFTLACPPPSLAVKRVPKEVSGLRRRYLEALQAHNDARERCEALKAEVTTLAASQTTKAGSPSAPTTSSPTSSASDENDRVKLYISLQRQRRRLRKLQAIQTALDGLMCAEPNPSRTDAAIKLKEELGDPPDLPPGATTVSSTITTTGGGFGNAEADAAVEELTARLKKEVLVAKNDLERTNKQREEVNRQTAAAIPNASLKRQVYALRRARDELVGWVEGELAKLSTESMINMDEEEPRTGEVKPEKNTTTTTDDDDESISPDSYSDRVQEKYQGYVTARASLVAVINDVLNAKAPNSTSPTVANTSVKDATDLSNPPTTTTEEGEEVPKVHQVLPFVSELVQMSRHEKAILQQTTFLRHQLLAASEESLRTLRRLADESHLVAPRSDSALAWVQAADESSKSTREFVEENLREGETHIAGAKGILEELQARDDAMRALNGAL